MNESEEETTFILFHVETLDGVLEDWLHRDRGDRVAEFEKEHMLRSSPGAKVSWKRMEVPKVWNQPKMPEE